MKKYFPNVVYSCVVGFVLLGSLSAAEKESEMERVPFQVRQLLKESEKELQDKPEFAANLDQNNQESEEEKRITKNEDLGEECLFNGASYYTSHKDAYHKLCAKTISGDLIEIEDGSSWVVRVKDRFKASGWFENDELLITVNHSWFSNYAFCLVNIVAGESVEVNLFQTPYYSGTYTRWIKEIDYINDRILLSDGSIWSISSFDHTLLMKWCRNDTVIIGINDSIFLGFSPNLLINVTASPISYVRGKCID